MSKEQLLIEILRLPVEERRELLEEARDSLPSDAVNDPDMTPALKAELDRRFADYLAHPENASPWKDVSARLRSRKSSG